MVEQPLYVRAAVVAWWSVVAAYSTIALVVLPAVMVVHLRYGRGGVAPVRFDTAPVVVDAVTPAALVPVVDTSVPRDPATDPRCVAATPTCVAFLGCSGDTAWDCTSEGTAEDGSATVRWEAVVVRIPDVEDAHRYLAEHPEPDGIVLYRWGGPYVAVETSWYSRCEVCP